MVRATYAKVKIRLGGTDPPTLDETAIDNLCIEADYILDGVTHPTTLSTTDNLVIAVAVSIVMNLIAEKYWFQAGGSLSDKVRPSYDGLTTQLREQIKRLMTSTTYDGAKAIRMQAAD